MVDQDNYQYPSYKKRYLNIPDGISREHHSLMRNRAENLLYFLKNFMKLSGLKQHQMRRVFDDGSKLFISSSYGLDSITYTGPVPLVAVSAEQMSHPIVATFVKQLLRPEENYRSAFIYFDIADWDRGWYIKIDDYFPSTDIKEPEIIMLLEENATLGVLIFKKGSLSDDQILTWIGAFKFQIIEEAETRETIERDGKPYDKVIIKHTYSDLDDTYTGSMGNPIPSFAPPYYVDGYINYTAAVKGGMCWIVDGDEEILSNLRWEIFCSVGHLTWDDEHTGYWDERWTYYTCPAILGDNGLWRSINLFDEHFEWILVNNPPWPVFWRLICRYAPGVSADDVYQAFGIYRDSGPLWCPVYGYFEGTSQKVYISFGEEQKYPSSPQLTGLVGDFSQVPYTQVGGAGWPAYYGRIGAYLTGGGYLQRISLVAGSAMLADPTLPPYGPWRILGPHSLKYYFINGVRYTESDIVPTKPTKFPFVGRELWRAKQKHNIPDSKGYAQVPTWSGSSSTTYHTPLVVLVSHTGRHPAFPNLEMNGGEIYKEELDSNWEYTIPPNPPVYLWRVMGVVMTAFGCAILKKRKQEN